MPTYEYECKSCGHQFEKFQSITARPLRACPQCKGSVRRLIGSGAAVIFKGSGFYQTDYRSSEYTQKAKADKDNASAEAPKEKPKSEESKSKDSARSSSS